ncbi:transcriptional regulator CadC, partial [Vibrio cholerae O1]|nr:transcriptional regulator CadC [Vibrio cholerae O1]
KFQDGFHAQALTHELADGIAQKLMADLTQVSDYRVILGKSAYSSGRWPGQSFRVRVNGDGGHECLELVL